MEWNYTIRKLDNKAYQAQSLSDKLSEELFQMYFDLKEVGGTDKELKDIEDAYHSIEALKGVLARVRERITPEDD